MISCVCVSPANLIFRSTIVSQAGLGWFCSLALGDCVAISCLGNFKGTFSASPEQGYFAMADHLPSIHHSQGLCLHRQFFVSRSCIDKFYLQSFLRKDHGTVPTHPGLAASRHSRPRRQNPQHTLHQRTRLFSLSQPHLPWSRLNWVGLAPSCKPNNTLWTDWALYPPSHGSPVRTRSRNTSSSPRTRKTHHHQPWFTDSSTGFPACSRAWTVKTSGTAPLRTR